MCENGQGGVSFAVGQEVRSAWFLFERSFSERARSAAFFDRDLGISCARSFYGFEHRACGWGNFSVARGASSI